ncbi:MAG: hypothetical protein ACRYG2_25065 [Janthinobacterium lividum]
MLALAAPLLPYAALAGCSSTPPPARSATEGSPAVVRQTGASPAVATGTAVSGPGSGKITFHGQVSGTMTVSSCPDDAPAQLTVVDDGQDRTGTGVIDADDLTFVVPRSTGYTLAAGAAEPTISGRTYTVGSARLVSITSDDTVTADGSVTCP